jgi:hypothetical protein
MRAVIMIQVLVEEAQAPLKPGPKNWRLMLVTVLKRTNGDMAEFEPSTRFSFSNFSFKNLSQLASINYDLLLQTGNNGNNGLPKGPG